MIFSVKYKYSVRLQERYYFLIGEVITVKAHAIDERPIFLIDYVDIEIIYNILSKPVEICEKNNFATIVFKFKFLMKFLYILVIFD